MKYKVVCIQQPHAELFLHGKEYETKPKPTSYRGPIALHAGKSLESLDRVAKMLRDTKGTQRTGFIASFHQVIDAWVKQRGLEGTPLKDLFDWGAVIAVGELTAVYDAGLLYPKLTGHAKHFGDFSAGRYAWRIQNVQRLPKPVPMRGQLYLWDWEYDVPSSAD